MHSLTAPTSLMHFHFDHNLRLCSVYVIISVGIDSRSVIVQIGHRTVSLFKVHFRLFPASPHHIKYNSTHYKQHYQPTQHNAHSATTSRYIAGIGLFLKNESIVRVLTVTATAA